MPTPPLSDELAREAVEAVRKHGGKSPASRALGIPYPTLQKRYRIAEARGLTQSPGARQAATAAGIEPTEHHSGWRKVYDEQGKHVDSVYYQTQKSEPEQIVDRIREALEGLPAVSAVAPPVHAEGDLLGLLPVADLHAGMMAWGREAGTDYSTQIATERLIDVSGRVVEAMPRCGVCVILFNGDTLHSNDQTNQTPRSKHHLDADTRQFRTVEMTISAIAVSIEHARRRHGHVVVVVKQGNHDSDAYLAVLFAIAERYRKEPRVTVIKDPREHWVYEWGSTLLFAHHGHRSKPQELVLGLAAAHPAEWGRSRFRYLWTGHLHHLKAADIGGVQWEQSRALTSRDAHAAAHLYAERAELQGVVYHSDDGEVERVRVAVRPG